MRILLWVVALAIGAVVVLIPARRLDVITIDGALNVIGGEGFKKWELPLVIVPPWAIVSAILAHLMIEGIGRLSPAPRVRGAQPFDDRGAADRRAFDHGGR